MPINYRPADFAASSSVGGGGGEGAEGAHQILQNFVDMAGIGGHGDTAMVGANKFTGATVQSSGSLFDGSQLPNCGEFLPKVEIVGANSATPILDRPPMIETGDLGGIKSLDGLASGANPVSSLLDMATKMADPFGFIGAILEFLVMFFVTATSQMMSTVMQNIQMYNRAAQAALQDSTKKMVEGWQD